MRKQFHLLKLIAAVLGTVILAACAINKSHPQDPYENFNRPIHRFNVAVDHAIYRPIGNTYRKLTPKAVTIGVHNFFSNLRQIPNVINDLLQAQFKFALEDSTRFVINSTFGVAGILDVATHMGLKPHYTDFGLTLARWGDKNSPYFVIPFLGPSTFRDAFAWPIDGFMTVYPYIEPVWVSYALLGTYYVNLRAELLDAEEALPAANFDDYDFMRNAYLQHRAWLLNPTDDKPSVLYVEE